MSKLIEKRSHKKHKPKSMLSKEQKKILKVPNRNCSSKWQIRHSKFKELVNWKIELKKYFSNISYSLSLVDGKYKQNEET